MPNPILTDCTDTLRLVGDRGPDGYGVPLYGSRFRGTSKLYDVLMDVRRDLETIGWWNYIESVLTAGLYVDKPGAHGKGIAIDIDGVVLKSNPFIDAKYGIEILTYARKPDIWTGLIPQGKYNHRPLTDRIKTRLACLLSLRFGVVLTAGYNAAHEDHIHADLSRTVKWRGYLSQVTLVQETLNAWFDAGLVVDGDFGKKTIKGWMHSFKYDGTVAEWWLDWLKMIAFNPPKDVPHD